MFGRCRVQAVPHNQFRRRRARHPRRRSGARQPSKLVLGVLVALIAGILTFVVATRVMMPKPPAHSGPKSPPENPTTTARPPDLPKHPTDTEKPPTPKNPLDIIAPPNHEQVVVEPGIVPPPRPIPGQRPGDNLFDAARKRDLAMAKRVLTTEAKAVNGRNYRGATALHLAAAVGDPAMVRLLLANGAEVNAICDKNFLTGQTPLHLAAGQGHLDIVRALLAHGADVNARDCSEAVPLHEAAIRGRREMVKLLLAKGAKIDAVQQDGYTPLFWAIQSNDLATTRLFLAKGANRHAQAIDGTTPVEFAEMLKFDAMVKVLKKE